jgi:hypothetical protein
MRIILSQIAITSKSEVMKVADVLDVRKKTLEA